MDYRRFALGIFAVVCIGGGVLLAFTNDGDNNSLSGILIRVGCMLAATWLAFPVIKTPEGKQSLFVTLALLGLVVLVAARPRLFIAGLIGLVVVTLANWVLKKLSSSL